MFLLVQFLTLLLESSKLGTEMRALSKVRMVVARKPISTTVPPTPFSVSTQSPCSNTSPAKMAIDPKMFAMVSLAAKAMAAPAIPSPERMAVRSTPKILSMAIMATKIIKPLIALIVRLTTSSFKTAFSFMRAILR